ncbi:MFS transporter [Hoylesella nanceiensis]|jgi:putative transport protein|uniref:MFS transporter n=1 Tax=Hoylesella nanceiensis TaxID=425941 RepID=UPI001CAF1D50|nr:MFS transporter [Hoylesella nanceiensis]MBF1426800.1 MFS transporter [Hoylesella nanceiensis]
MNSIQPEHISRHKGSVFTLCTFFCLYIAQAVPSSFLSTALQVLMRENNFSLTTIGLLQLVKLPWIIKFLWAPMVDRRCVRVNDYKRTIIVSELVYAALLLTIGFLHVSTDIYFIIFLVVLSLVTSGTQDVATDALAVLTFKKSDKSMVNSMQSMGSFGGALLGGGVLLMALHRYGWQTVLPFLAIFVLIALLPLLFNKHLTINEKPKETKAKKADFIWFFTQKGIWKQIVFLVIYYAGIFGTLSLLRSFLVDHGYNMKEIGLISGVLGTGVAFFASWGAGFFVRKYGVFKARIAFACIILITTLYFFLMLSDTITTLRVCIGVTLLWATYGMCTIVVYVSSMERVRPGREGTDFTIQTVITHLSGMMMAVVSGAIAQHYGYRLFFAIEIAIALASLVYILSVFKQKETNNERTSN